MDTHSQQPLEELIHRELSKLPDRSAPDSLIPRVLDKIRARAQKPWWQRPWTQWPMGVQVASLPLMFASVGLTVFGLSILWKMLTVESALESFADRFDSLSPILDVVTALGNAVLLLGRAVGEQWLLAALLVPFGMYAACVGLGTLCYRMASYKR